MKKFVALDHLNEVVDQALCKLGLDLTERTIVRHILMYAERRASTQGLIKIKERTVLPDPNCNAITTDTKTPSVASVNGGGHTGMVVLHEATLVAERLVKNSGIALVSTNNTRSSTGAIGYYAHHLAKSGYIALVLAGSPKVMAIEGGIDPVFGTNPIAIAIPTNDEPLVLDMATAATTWFAVINARDNNDHLPANVALDKDGKPTIDPLAAMSGAIKAFGGAKGSGLALMFEFLTGVLGNASLMGDSEDNRSNTIIAIDPSVIGIEGQFQSRASELVKRLRESRTTDNAALRLPGEYSNAIAEQCESQNQIAIDADLYQHLLALSR